MEYVKETRTVIVFNKKYELDKLIDSFSEFSAKQIENFFVLRGIQFPKRIHCLALIKVLNEKIKGLNSLSLTKAQFTKLQHYDNFTEFQLINLMAKLINPEDYDIYRRTIWELIFENYATINLSDGEVQHLITIKKNGYEDFSIYSSILSKIGVDIESEFDGCPKEKLHDAFKYTFSSDEMIILAKAYDINISSSLKRDDLVECIKDILKGNKKNNSEVLKELDSMTGEQLNEYCKKNKIQLSTHLTKNQMAFYFLYLIGKKSISTLKIKRIVGMDDIKPLVFSVDLSVIKPFGKGEAQKIIYYDETPEVVEEEVVIPEPIEVKEEVVEPVQEKVVEEITLSVNIVEEKPEVVEEISVDEVSTEEVKEETPIVDQTPIIAVKEEAPVVLEEPIVNYNPSEDEGKPNPYFRSKKFEKKSKKLWLFILAVLFIAAFIFAVYCVIKHYL